MVITASGMLWAGAQVLGTGEGVPAGAGPVSVEEPLPPALPAISPGRPSSPGAAFAVPGELPDEVTTPGELRNLARFVNESTREDVPGLRGLALHATDPLVAANALRGLSRLGAVADDAEILALVEDPRIRVRQEVIRALGESGSATALGTLIRQIDVEDPRLRLLVIQALGRLGDRAARKPLVEIAGSATSSEVEKVFAREALDRLDPSGAPGRRRRP
jgi:HEAT repeat protein